jgi:Saxitoxin biosynthesis operon protein SxtJ
MKWSDLPLRPTHRVLRQFAAAWLVFFLALALNQWLRHRHPTLGMILSAVALLGLAGLFKPPAVRWLFVGATVVTFPIGWVVSHILLGAMFYLVFTPLALVFRWRGRDELQLRRRREKSSFWVTRADPPEAGRYLKQF